MLSKEAVSEFQELYMREYGRPITFDQAQELATNLLRFYKTILGHGKPKENQANGNR